MCMRKELRLFCFAAKFKHLQVAVQEIPSINDVCEREGMCV